jgi:two-component system, NtrC family, sensor kinase
LHHFDIRLPANRLTGLTGQRAYWHTSQRANGKGRNPLATRGLKTRIAWNVALLLLLSAIITDALVVLVLHGLIVRHEVTAARRRIEGLGSLYFSGDSNRDESEPSGQDLATTLILALADFPTLQIVNEGGNSLYRQTCDRYPVEQLDLQIHKARQAGHAIVQEYDYAWSTFWWHPRIVSIAIPILRHNQIQGVIGAILPLTALQKQINQYHKPIYLYILINTVVLTIVGLYRIFRLYLRPIDRIVRQADDFHEDVDPFFSFRQEDDELQRLSSALNRMLNRIAHDKKKLQDTVMSLERANAELQNAQKEILRAEKMASVGRLAAGIAHEIGNPLGIVLGYLEMLKQNDLDDSDKTDFLQRTEDEIQRINTVIRQLLDLARPQTGKAQSIQVHFIIQDVVDIMRMQPIMRDIHIDLALQAEDVCIWANEDPLRQVFLNLLLNAADAIHSVPDGPNGKITVSTEMGAFDDPGRNPCLRIVFRDNGSGIDPQKLQNIFDPFYTTKEPGKGTGLGLSVSYMIIEMLGGNITAVSEVDDGAAFIIELPLSGQAAAS